MGKALTIYDGLNRCVLSFVPPGASTILDVGCGTGVLGECLRRDRECTIVGITYSDQEALLAQRRLSRVICAELNGFDFAALGTFDCVILSHVLEHLHSPENTLESLKGSLLPKSVILVALPNVVWWRQRLEFLAGRWRYRDWGILDRTHFRFFDRKSSRELLEDAGFEILRSKCDGTFPMGQLLRKRIGGIAAKIDRLVCKLAPGLFTYQFVYLARIKR